MVKAGDIIYQLYHWSSNLSQQTFLVGCFSSPEMLEKHVADFYPDFEKEKEIWTMPGDSATLSTKTITIKA